MPATAESQLVAPAGVIVADKSIKPLLTLTGSVADEKLQDKAPQASHIADAKAWESLRNAWKLGDEAKKVDAQKHLVLVGTTRGSRIGGTPTLDDKGDLTFAPFSTRDLRPGFRYVIVVVPRAGVKSVNGKPL